MKGLLAPAAALVALFGLALPASAADAGTGGRSQPAAVSNERMDYAKLKEVLETMGYPVKEQKNTDGTPLYVLDFDEGGFHFIIDVNLSTDGSVIWLNAPLGNLPAAKRPAGTLEKLLKENMKRDPDHFDMYSDGYLDMARYVENRDVTPAVLRQAINEMCNDMRQTEALWNPAKWATNPRTNTGPNAQGKQ